MNDFSLFKTLFLVCAGAFLSPAGVLFAAEDEPVTVAKVRIVIEDETYEWIDRARLPERRGATFTVPATVASFLDFAPDDLDMRVREAGDRLAAKPGGLPRRALGGLLHACHEIFSAKALLVTSGFTIGTIVIGRFAVDTLSRLGSLLVTSRFLSM